jgi:RsiW-degrading membrane proteinase PrsW (M82 family)
LTFSQSQVPPPAQSDVGKQIAAIGYYGQLSQCAAVNGCPALFVQAWGPHYGHVSMPTATGCFFQANSGSSWQTVQCVTAPTIPLVGGLNMNSLQANLSYNVIAILIVLIILLGYLITRRKK